MYDIIIIGGGAAGLTAAMYAARGGADVLLLGGAEIGGQALKSHFIENFSGVHETDGYSLTDTMRKQAVSSGAKIRRERVTNVDVYAKKVTVESGDSYECRALIIATGARHRRLGIEGEEEALGQGVSYCATCDGFFFRKEDVAVVGGGDTALTEAIYLSDICNRVYLIHRRERFRASRVLVDRLSEISNISYLRDSVVTSLKGRPLEGIEIERLGEKMFLPVKGLFVAVGMEANVDIVRDSLAMDGEYIETDSTMATSVEGVFAAGDVRNGPLKQLITACADGAVAASSAIAYINKRR